MNLRTRTGQWLAAAAVIGGAALLVPAVALASATGPARPATPRCTAASTEAWLGIPGNGAAGTIYYPLEFSNIGSHACTLQGYPGVSALSASLHQLGQAARRIPTHHAAVTLRPGQTSYALLGIEESGAICPGSSRTAQFLRVYPPGQRAPQLIGYSFGACSHRGVLAVGQVHAGPGVPALAGP
ncbi:MAG: DUF4232 domain-containing protein [Streptosporangiaceae bacterium]